MKRDILICKCQSIKVCVYIFLNVVINKLTDEDLQCSEYYFNHYFQLPSYCWTISTLVDCTHPPGQHCSSRQKFTEPNTVGLIRTNLQMGNRLDRLEGDCAG